MIPDEATPWTPGPEPDPGAILQAARAETAAGRYAEALEKHLWIHYHALTHQPAFYGVRLSFALADWVRLGRTYPAALEALVALRDANAAALRAREGGRETFHDYASINQWLGDRALTVQLFRELHSRQPETAAAVYDLAQRDLILAGEYRLCGDYLHPETFLTGWKTRLRQCAIVPEELAATITPEILERALTAARRSFTDHTVNLVALLVRNDRQAEADRIAELAAAESDEPEFHQLLQAARQGQFPTPRRRGKGSDE